jgi:hypothetical protein
MATNPRTAEIFAQDWHWCRLTGGPLAGQPIYVRWPHHRISVGTIRGSGVLSPRADFNHPDIQFLDYCRNVNCILEFEFEGTEQCLTSKDKT